ncbi:hypothetical protein D3C78_1601880 [compost metagenome]
MFYQSADFRQVLFPMLAHAQNGFHQFAGADLFVVMLGPQLLIAIKPVLVILYRITFPVALSAIERNQRGKGKRKTSR